MKHTRNTPQRQLVLAAVRSSHGHPSAEDIFALVHQKDAKISCGTVYRNLKLLAEQGEITDVTMPLGPHRYEWRTDHHYHFLCRNCGKVSDVDLAFREDLTELAPELPGHRVESHRLIFTGLCPVCSGTGAKS